MDLQAPAGDPIGDTIGDTPARANGIKCSRINAPVRKSHGEPRLPGRTSLGETPRLPGRISLQVMDPRLHGRASLPTAEPWLPGLMSLQGKDPQDIEIPLLRGRNAAARCVDAPGENPADMFRSFRCCLTCTARSIRCFLSVFQIRIPG